MFTISSPLRQTCKKRPRSSPLGGDDHPLCFDPLSSAMMNGANPPWEAIRLLRGRPAPRILQSIIAAIGSDP